MGNIRLLFMGASRLVGLLERFSAAAQSLEVGLEMFSLEDNKPWHAIGAAGLAKIVPAPKFDAEDFEDFLLHTITRHRIDIVIPNVDPATIALSKAAERVRVNGALPICSSFEVCKAMADKHEAEKVFLSLNLPVPDGVDFPLIAKPRFGASSRNMAILRNQAELECWKKFNKVEDFIVQPFVSGKEYTLDAYVSGTGQTLGLVSRVRVVVSGGESMVTQIERNEGAIALTKKLLQWGTWHGPVTVQVIEREKTAWLIECNPRFGSGVTCSIEAGLAIPEWILRERLGLPLPDKPVLCKDGLCMTRSRKDHFLWLS